MSDNTTPNELPRIPHLTHCHEEWAEAVRTLASLRAAVSVLADGATGTSWRAQMLSEAAVALQPHLRRAENALEAAAHRLMYHG